MFTRLIRSIQVYAFIFATDVSRHPRKMIIFGIYRTFILVTFIGLFIHELPTMEFWVSNVINFHSILALLEVILHWGVLIINFIITWSRNSLIRRAIIDLEALHLTLRETQVTKLIRAQNCYFFAFAALCVVYNLIGHTIVWQNEFYTPYTAVIYIVTDFCNGFTAVAFTHTVWIILLYFQELNNHLRNTFKATRKLGPMMYFQITSKQIAKIRSTHLKLCTISETINDCFSVQLLLTVALNTVESIYSLRSMVSYITRSQDSGKWSSQPWLEVSLTTMWCLLFLGSLVILIAACDSAASESQKTRLITHELLNLDMGDSWQRELLIFSQQLTHHTAHFTAGRLLVLRFPLLRSIIGSIVTYLVIIMTFKG